MTNTERNDVSDIHYYSSVTPVAVKWLWYPFIPFGKITVLQGDPGDGKSTMVIDLIGRLTTARVLPDGSNNSEVINCVYQCQEDSVEDTIKPRLINAGTDCSKVAYINDDEVALTLADLRIEHAIESTNAKLLVLDPIQSFISQEGDMQNAVRIRVLLKKLSVIAYKYNCAVLLIGHMNKSESSKKLYRGLGSIDITAVARSVLMIHRDPENQEIRHLSQIKSNLAPEGDSLAFRIDEYHKIKWLGKCSSSSLSDNGVISNKSKLETAKKLILLFLGKGEMPSAKIMEDINSFGISARTINTAKKELKIKTIKRNNIWFWKIPSPWEENNG